MGVIKAVESEIAPPQIAQISGIKTLLKNRIDILNGSQIDENPKNPPRVGDPEYLPPIRL